MNTTNITQ